MMEAGSSPWGGRGAGRDSALPSARSMRSARDGALSRTGGWRRAPAVADIRLALLVARAVSPLHRLEAVPLVEPAGRPVHLERPQLQPGRPQLLGQRDKPLAEPAAAPGRRQVQL